MHIQRKLRFEKTKFQTKIGRDFSVLLSLIGAAAVLMVAILISYYLGQKVSNHPFQFHNLSDAVLVLMWTLAGVLPLAIFFRNKKKSIFLTITVMFTEGAWISTLLGFLLNPRGHLSELVVQHMLEATKETYLATAIVMIVMAVITIRLLIQKIKQNTWVLFLVMAPYIVFSWKIERSYDGFNKMLQADKFSVHFLYRMLVRFNGNVDLINEMVFQLMAISVAGLFVSMGIVVYEFIYQKTQNWRTTKA